MKKENLKLELLESVNSMDEITVSFSLMSNDDKGATSVFGDIDELVNLLAYNFKTQPLLLEIINKAVMKVAKDVVSENMKLSDFKNILNEILC